MIESTMPHVLLENQDGATQLLETFLACNCFVYSAHLVFKLNEQNIQNSRRGAKVYL